MARSSAQAEYRSLAITAYELLWIQSLFQELKIHCTTPTIFYDNLRTLAFSHNPVLHSRTKYIELDIFFVIEKLLNRYLIVTHVLAQDLIVLFPKFLIMNQNGFNTIPKFEK